MRADTRRSFREFWAEERARAAKSGKLSEFETWGERCLQFGLSQKQLAARTGIAQTEISRLERGEGNPTLRTLSKIASALQGRLTLEFRAQPRRGRTRRRSPSGK
jgi:DNA-binding XRE family transcriptional regulator